MSTTEKRILSLIPESLHEDLFKEVLQVLAESKASKQEQEVKIEKVLDNLMPWAQKRHQPKPGTPTEEEIQQILKGL